MQGCEEKASPATGGPPVRPALHPSQGPGHEGHLQVPVVVEHGEDTYCSSTYSLTQTRDPIRKEVVEFVEIHLALHTCQHNKEPGQEEHLEGLEDRLPPPKLGTT